MARGRGWQAPVKGPNRALRHRDWMGTSVPAFRAARVSGGLSPSNPAIDTSLKSWRFPHFLRLQRHFLEPARQVLLGGCPISSLALTTGHMFSGLWFLEIYCCLVPSLGSGSPGETPRPGLYEGIFVFDSHHKQVWKVFSLHCVCRILVVAWGIFSRSMQTLSPGPLLWELGVLASGPPGKSHVVFSDVNHEGVKQDSGIFLSLFCFEQVW